MPHYNGPRQVYDELVEKSDVSWLLGLLACAVVEEQRIEWEKHFAQRERRELSDEEVRGWYRELPAAQLLRARGDAENALRVYAAQVWDEFRERERDSVRDGVIVEEIRLSRRFWPQFGIGIASGIVSSLVFALMLLALLTIVQKDPSPIGIGRSLMRGGSTGGSTSETR